MLVTMEYNASMSQAETIFNPLDNSLKERVRAYYSVSQAFQLSAATQKPKDYIGDKTEVDTAFNVLLSSFADAKKSVSNADLKTAKEDGYLDDEQLKKIVQANRAHEMATRRATTLDSHQDTTKNQR